MKKSMVAFTVLYKVSHKFDTDRSADPTVYTFTTLAISREDAIHQLQVSRYTHVKGSKRPVRFVKKFKVVDVYTTKHGEGMCTCNYCKMNPTMARKVTVLKSKMPGYMKRSYTR